MNAVTYDVMFLCVNGPACCSMARLTIHSEPPVALFTIPFIYNILMQHTALLKMIHRKDKHLVRYRPVIRVRDGSDLVPIATFDAAEEAVEGDDIDVDDKGILPPPVLGDEPGDADSDDNSDDDDDGAAKMPALKPSSGGKVASKKVDGPVNEAGIDPFDAVTNDLSKCRATDSSLWELTVLMCHHNPTVSSLARVFSTKFNVQRKPVEVCVAGC